MKVYMTAEFNKAYDPHFNGAGTGWIGSGSNHVYKKSTAINKAKRLQKERGLKFGIVQMNQL